MAKTKESFSQLTLLAIEAALAAGDLLRYGFGSHFLVKTKKEGTHNLVTEYDHKAEKLIIDFLTKCGPKAQFLAEESGLSKTRNKGLTWIIDPLDGTVNFVHQIPIFAVSIALEHKGEVISGVIHQPITHELFVAEKGKGSFLNGEKLHVSTVHRLSQAILATGFPYNLAKNPFHCIEHFIDILHAGIPIRRLGAAAIDLAYTAAGRFEGYFEVALAPWDCAAGRLLVEEAGGKVSGWDNTSFDIYAKKPLLASNGKVHKEALALLSKRIP